MKCKFCGSPHIHQISTEVVHYCLNPGKTCKTEIDFDSEYQDYECQDCGRMQYEEEED